MCSVSDGFYEKLEKENKYLIGRIQLDRDIIKKEENEHPIHLSLKNLEFIKQSIQIIPLWNGGLNAEGNYDFVVMLNLNDELELKKDFHNIFTIKKRKEND